MILLTADRRVPRRISRVLAVYDASSAPPGPCRMAPSHASVPLLGRPGVLELAGNMLSSLFFCCSVCVCPFIHLPLHLPARGADFTAVPFDWKDSTPLGEWGPEAGDTGQARGECGGRTLVGDRVGGVLLSSRRLTWFLEQGADWMQQKQRRSLPSVCRRSTASNIARPRWRAAQTREASRLMSNKSGRRGPPRALCLSHSRALRVHMSKRS